MVELRDSTVWDYLRFVISFVLLLFSTVVTIYAIVNGNTGFWKSVPGPVALLLFFICLLLLGIVEGLQISLVELKRQHPDSYKNTHKRSYQLAQIANSKDNVERFLMGRQVLVVFLVFFIAKLTTISLQNLETDFFFHVPNWLYSSLLETGFLTCILVVIVSQLMPQIVAAKYPVHFLNMRIMYFFYHVCTFIEATGLTHACWVLSYLLGKIAGMASEEIYFKKTLSESDDTDLKSQISSIDKSQTTEDMMQILVKTVDVEISEEKQTLLRCYLNQHPEHFYSFPSVIGDKVYASPQELAERFRKINVEPPTFLLDISDPQHIPPHIVACQLMVKVAELKWQLNERYSLPEGV
uniref:Uncharacterized protein LOC108950256 n=1 Tax=Phallusia mammillata TaxID=59560 RepID=A0A6F9DIJ8_9ASCI|nr:uncharacterized protein LOC108950256 [Phallusia mammillata]